MAKLLADDAYSMTTVMLVLQFQYVRQIKL